MELTHSSLVAIMFVMVLAIGIGIILGALAALVSKRAKLAIPWLGASWPLLLLLAHLELFWQTLTILELEQWSFGGFLYILCGPVLLFVATSLLLGEPEHLVASGLVEHYLAVCRDFFVLLFLVEAWMCGVDLGFGGGLTAESGWSFVLMALFLLLAASKSRRLHQAGTVAAWLVFVLQMLLRGMGVIT